jgi:carboxymethylenebutenolidase
MPPSGGASINEGPMSESVMRGVPMAETSLRDVVEALLPQGYARLVQPIASTAISTDTQGLTAGEVRIQTMTGPVPAYRAMPEKGGKAPLVLVVQEIFGVHEHIKDVCRRLAKLGYFAIAVDLYHRQGDVTKFTDNQEIFAKVVNHVPDSQVMSDLDSSVVYAESTGRADTGKLGITGFCWGGRVTWTYCVHNPKVKAGVAWYGRLVAPSKSPLQPAYPADLAPALKVPVLGLYGGQDASIPMEQVEQMRAALKAANNTTSNIHVYPEAPHAFYADYRPSYRKEAAEDGWKRMQAWFKQYGVA